MGRFPTAGMTCEVNPDVLIFTQDSIRNKFKKPHEDERIDDAVDSILQGKLKASDFPRLDVVCYDEQLWSLDNRRLWVFKKARVPIISVRIVPYNSNPRFKDLVELNPSLKEEVLQQGYWPRVRGNARTVFKPPVPVIPHRPRPPAVIPRAQPKEPVASLPKREYDADFDRKSYRDVVDSSLQQEKSAPAHVNRAHSSFGLCDKITKPERHKQVPTVATDATEGTSWRNDVDRNPVNNSNQSWKDAPDTVIDIHLPEKAQDQPSGASKGASPGEPQSGKPTGSSSRWSRFAAWLKGLWSGLAAWYKSF